MIKVFIEPKHDKSEDFWVPLEVVPRAGEYIFVDKEVVNRPEDTRYEVLQVQHVVAKFSVGAGLIASKIVLIVREVH